jgi:putative transposase
MAMVFKEGHLFHVFNRGNNREVIFFNSINYMLFIDKIVKYISPYADILAWCLMPNHFHLMLEVKHLELDGRTLNDSIAVMLRSYARAINNQEQRVGSLFQSGTKAINLTDPDIPFFSSRNYFYGPTHHYLMHKSEYPFKCMEYIHDNPVKAGLVERPEDWEYSSYREYIGLGKCTLSCIQKGWEYIRFTR